MRVLVINGPNLDRLGTREPEVYGSTTLSELEEKIESWARSLGVTVDFLQSNHEGAIIDAVHGSDHDGLVMNPGALTHTSRALADAIASSDIPAVEVHISNVRERESWRRVSVLTEVAAHTIYGRGIVGYQHALRHLVNRAAFDFETVAYGPHTDNHGDLRRGGSGLVVLVHGGFWRHEWTRDTMESLAVDLASRGHNTWNIEYRRLGTGGRWPGCGQDVLTAFEFIPRLGLDVEGATVIGHSAGGHLAIWAGATARSEIKKIIGLAAVTDLGMHARSDLFGSSEAQELLDAGAPSRTPPGPIDTVLFHGIDDDLVPEEQSSEYAQRWNARHERVPGGHFELLDPRRDQWAGVIEQIDGV